MGMLMRPLVSTICHSVGSDPTQQHQDEDDDQYGADYADATVSVAVAIAPEAAAKATKEEDDK
jgi:hypothetical protein